MGGSSPKLDRKNTKQEQSTPIVAVSMSMGKTEGERIRELIDQGYSEEVATKMVTQPKE